MQPARAGRNRALQVAVEGAQAMQLGHRLERLSKWIIAAGALMSLGYAGYAAGTWRRYGRVAPPAAGEQDPLLDRFMPIFEVVDRHHVEVAAPAAVTLA